MEFSPKKTEDYLPNYTVVVSFLRNESKKKRVQFDIYQRQNLTTLLYLMTKLIMEPA